MKRGLKFYAGKERRCLNFWVDEHKRNVKNRAAKAEVAKRSQNGAIARRFALTWFAVRVMRKQSNVNFRDVTCAICI